MRIVEKFKPSGVTEIVKHLNEIRMGTIVSVFDGTFAATPLPWVARELEGDRVELLGHFAASNPQVQQIAEQPAVFVTFLGPNAYVSPRGLPTPRSAPTWNFTAIHIAGEAELLDPQTTDCAVETLVATVERGRPEPWTSDEMGTRREQLMRQVVGVRVISRRIDAKYKLGQNESVADLRAILRQLSEAGHTRLVAMMHRANTSRLTQAGLPGSS